MGKEEVFEVLKNVFDPDYLDKSIIDMGLIDEEDIKIEGDKIEIEYKVTAPLCPFSAAIGVMVKYAIEKKLGKRVDVRIKSGHIQSELVNDILQDEQKRKDILKMLESYGLLEQCIRLSDEH